MDYQLLALDLDGTLTNSDKEISAPTLEALIDIQKKGKKVVLASGRAPMGITPLAKQLHLEDYGSYILSFNGGRITDCRTGNIIYNKQLPLGVTAPLFDIVKKYDGADIVAYESDAILSGLTPNQYTELEARISHAPIVHVEDFAHTITPENKLLITGDPEIIEKIRIEAIRHFRTYLSIYCSDPFFLEIMPPGIDKAHSLLRLLGAIGLTPDQMICCGDGYNDVSMIETAGLGVAMANAVPAVKEKANYITKSNDEDGVLHVINEFLR